MYSMSLAVAFCPASAAAGSPEALSRVNVIIETTTKIRIATIVRLAINFNICVTKCKGHSEICCVPKDVYFGK